MRTTVLILSLLTFGPAAAIVPVQPNGSDMKWLVADKKKQKVSPCQSSNPPPYCR